MRHREPICAASRSGAGPRGPKPAARLRGVLRPAVFCAVFVVVAAIRAQVPSSQTQPASTQPVMARVAREPVAKATNPHWNTTDCLACHEKMVDDKPSPIPLTSVNAICWKCHDGKRAHQEVHPVARRFAGKDVVAPAAWPIPNGELSCVTCHDFGRGHARGGPRPERNAWMLRGYTGGSLSDFCAKCHVASPAHKPFNPHVMLDDKGEVNLRNCLLCHRETSDVIQHKTRTGQPDLLADPISLCVRCHQRHVDYFEPGHIGRPVPAGIRAYMLAREDLGMGTTLTPAEIARYEGISRQPQRSPLGPGNRLVCSTCHNPHQHGLFPPNSPLGLGGMKVHVPNRPPEMRGLGKETCRGCHGK